MKTFNHWLNEQCGFKGEEADSCLSTVFDAYDEMYSRLRICKKGTYAEPFSDMKSREEFLDAMWNSTPDVTAANQGGWVFRLNKRLHPADVNERFSLNVAPSVELIKDMDAFMKKYSSDVAEYKGPDNVDNWGRRHDPVTVYCHEIKPEMVADMIKIASKHVRKGADAAEMTGEVLSLGLSRDVEPTAERVSALVKRTKRVCGELFDDVFEDQIRKSDGVMSAGSYSVVKKMVDSYVSDKKDILPKSIDDYKLFNREVISYEDYEKRNIDNVENCSVKNAGAEKELSLNSRWKKALKFIKAPRIDEKATDKNLSLIKIKKGRGGR